jgi:DNA-binding response OmpR family regulator
MRKEFSRRFRVLIVTPDEDFHCAASKAFAEHGLDVQHLGDASLARDVAAQTRPDLVLLDVDVPAFDGRDLLTALKRDSRTRTIPVFLMSGVERLWGRSSALQLGADEYLEKPLSLRGVAWRIFGHLERQAQATSGAAHHGVVGNGASDIDRRQAEVLHAEERKRASAPKIRATGAAKRSVLIIEDDEDVRETLAQILEDEGLSTLAARNGQEALDLLHTEGVNPSLILLDLMMPVMNGWEFRRQMESDASIPQTPVVVMSARSRDHTVASAAWLQKPLRVDELLTTIQRVSRASA